MDDCSLSRNSWTSFNLATWVLKQWSRGSRGFNVDYTSPSGTLDNYCGCTSPVPELAGLKLVWICLCEPQSRADCGIGMPWEAAASVERSPLPGCTKTSETELSIVCIFSKAKLSVVECLLSPRAVHNADNCLLTCHRQRSEGGATLLQCNMDGVWNSSC